MEPCIVLPFSVTLRASRRRPAPAAHRGARVPAQAAPDRGRRAGFDDRRLTAGDDPRHHAEAEGRFWHQLPVHHPRPVHRLPDQRPHLHPVRGHGVRNRRRHSGHRQPAASLYPVSDRFLAHTRPSLKWSEDIEVSAEEELGKGEKAGCKFTSRCPHAMEECHRSPPRLCEVGEDDLYASC